MIKACVICGTPFLAKDGRNKFCSEECRVESLNQSKKKWVEEHIGKRTEKICVVCGKPFMPKQSSKQKACSELCRRELKREKARIQSRNRPHTMAAYIERLAKQKEATKKRKIEEHKKRLEENTIIGKCAVCGNTFKTFNPAQRTCSSECGKKWKYHKQDKRLKGKIVDDDITLEALYKKDSGVCYLCGCKCDWDDKEITSEGYTITHGKYPTIEHVLPLSKGGMHEWKNIRLACFSCNVKKGDSLIFDEDYK